MEPLSLSTLTIARDVTPEDLRSAFQILQQSKNNLTFNTGFQKIEVSGTVMTGSLRCELRLMSANMPGASNPSLLLTMARIDTLRVLISS